MKKHIVTGLTVVLAVWLIATRHAFFRIDLTEEGRYSLSDASCRQLERIEEPMTLNIYLAGDLDANMLRLRHEILDLVDEMNVVADNKIEVCEIDPSDAPSDEKRYANYQALEARGMRGMSVTNRERNGKISEGVVFPWAELCSEHDTMQICLLQPGSRTSGEESVNVAVEDIEFEIIDAVRVLTDCNPKRIAFIDGHGELDEAHTFDIMNALSRYFYVDRGILGSDPEVLNDYAAIVIAKPVKPFSESDKYIIDQYVMRGGSVLWLIDGVQMSDSMLSLNGMTPLIANDVNLNDMLFRYGVRITPTVLEDMQCGYMPVNMSRVGETPRFEPIPWTFSPLLQLSPLHPVTKTLNDIKADYAAGIEIVGDTFDMVKEVLMVTSNASHVNWAPSEIDVMQAIKVEPEQYFVNSFIPVGVAMEGVFTSVFTHRTVPDGINQSRPTVERSPRTRMVVVADGDMARNEIQRQQDGSMSFLPVGYDRVTRQQHGNRDFIINAMLYLTDSDGVMQLRRKQVGMHLLNRVSAEQNRSLCAVVNIALPIILLLVVGFIYNVLRKRKYAGAVSK